ncbi:MAG: MATE family efflux transporter, partial [Pseudomonadota bacterium]
MADTQALPTPEKEITHRRVLAIALPIVLSNATVPLLGAVDTGVVGQLGEAAPIGAVGIGAVILSAIYWIFGFLRMGTVGLTGQAAGAGDKAEVSAILTRGLVIGLTGGALLIACQTPLLWASFSISPASGEVENLARQYLGIRIWSAPAAIAGYAVTGWLIGQERTKSVFVIQIWMNSLNIVLDLVFVMGFGWGVKGVAFATFLAEWSGFALGLWLCRDAFATKAWRDWTRVLARSKLVRLANVSSDLLVRSVTFECVFVSFMLVGSRFGDMTLAANQILLQFLHFTAFALDGFAFAAEALVAQAFGAKNRAAVRLSAIFTSSWAGAVSVLMTLVFLAGGPAIIDLMSTSEGVREAARTYVIYVAFVPIFGVAAFMLDGIFVGAVRSRDMRNTTLISGAAYGISALLLLQPLGNHGLWFALM